MAILPLNCKHKWTRVPEAIPSTLALSEKMFYWKPVFIILMQGRFGNLMFEYALLLSLRFKYPEYTGYLYRDKLASGKTGYAYELETAFGISSSDFASDELMAYIQTIPPSSVCYIWEVYFSCKQQIVLGNSLVTICSGYWQTESYIEEIRSEVRKCFQFDTNRLNIQTREAAEKIRSQYAVGIHVRRGDYVLLEYEPMYGGICTIDYYTKAYKLIQDREQNHYSVYLFTDDPVWVRENMAFANSMVVNWNQGEDSWQDMYLMSLCRHNIIANSTFSWWGAWLNSNTNKIVVAPYRCFNTMLAPGIHPKEWLTIPPVGYVNNEFIRLIEHNEIAINETGLFYGKVGVAVFLFHYASIRQDKFYETIAMHLIGGVFSQLNEETSIDYADGLSGIGTVVEYLAQNSFISGDTNEILLDFDLLLGMAIEEIEPELDFLGLIHYFRFRIMGQCVDSIYEQDEKNKSNLKCLIDLLVEKKEFFLSYKEDFISELYELSTLNLHPEQVDILLDYYLPISNNSSEERIQQAAQINKERIDKIQFQNTPGLMGMAGRELKTLSPVSKVHWTQLL